MNLKEETLNQVLIELRRSASSIQANLEINEHTLNERKKTLNEAIESYRSLLKWQTSADKELHEVLKAINDIEEYFLNKNI